MDIQSQIEYIEGRYNPENDAGIVTWCDMRLLALIEKMAAKIEALEEQVERLENPSEYDALMIAETIQRAQRR